MPLFTSATISKIIRQGSLPSPPSIVARLAKLLSDPNFDSAAVVELVESDPSSAARAINVANSVAFKGASQVRSVRDAVKRLGARQTRAVVADHAMRSVFNPVSPSAMVLLKREWQLSAYVAGLLKQAAERDAKLAIPDEAYTLGLFHNIGLLPLMCAIPEPDTLFSSDEFYQEACRHAGPLGMLLTRQWALGPQVEQVARSFGQESTASCWEVTDTVAVARIAAAGALKLKPYLSDSHLATLRVKQIECLPKLDLLAEMQNCAGQFQMAA